MSFSLPQDFGHSKAGFTRLLFPKIYKNREFLLFEGCKRFKIFHNFFPKNWEFFNFQLGQHIG